MTPELIIALGLALVIGLLLGAMGSGGSIVTLPVLVYVAHIAPQSAVGMSMAIVGVTSAAAAYLHWRLGSFHAKAVLLLGTTGIFGAYVGSAFTHRVSSSTLMLLFAGLMLVVGLVMLRGGFQGLAPGVCRPIRCAAVGAVVGLLTGFLGVGGGFLLVPALVLFAGLDTKTAVGTSLAIIALNSAAGFLGQLRYAAVSPSLTGLFITLALVGMLGGLAVTKQVSEATLRKVFASLLLVVACAVGTLNTLEELAIAPSPSPSKKSANPTSHQRWIHRKQSNDLA
jgi:hypothetical protein